MDGEILISLTEKHAPTASSIAMLRRELPTRFARAAVLLSAGRHRRSGAELRPAGADRCAHLGPGSGRGVRAGLADRARPDARARAWSTRTCSRCPNAPALTVDVDRALATQTGVTQQEAANNVLVATNSSAQTAPNFWVDPRNSVSYPLVVQVPTYRIDSSQDLQTLPVTSSGGRRVGPAAAESRLLRPRARCRW